MSKLIDKIKQNSRTVVQPMGFGRETVAQAKPRILLLAAITSPGETSPPELAEGADAGLVCLGGARSDAKTFKNYSDSDVNIPWGGWLTGNKKPEGKQIASPDCDFILFPPDTLIRSLITDRETGKEKDADSADKGKLLVLDESLSNGLLRTVDDLLVDAVVITGQDEFSPPLNWQRLMIIRQYTDIISKPLLVTVSCEVTAGELQALWEGGVNGVIVDAVKAKAGDIKSLRDTIDKTAFHSQKKRGRVKALLPYVSAGSEEEPDEDSPDDL